MLPDARRGALLRAALVRRKEEVDRKIASRTLAPDVRVGAAADVEETLRVLMVRLWPKVRRGDASREQLGEFLRHLFELQDVAHGDDLRFLDAWNNAYEALDVAGDSEDVSLFLVAYSRILGAHIERRAA